MRPTFRPLTATARLALIALAICPPARADETEAEGSVYTSFPVPRDFLEAAVLPDRLAKDPFSANYQPPKPVTWDEHPYLFPAGAILDAAPLLRQAGIPFREKQDLAFFHAADRMLYVRSGRGSADLVDQFTGGLGPCYNVTNIQIEVIVIGLRDSSLFQNLLVADDPRAEADKLPADAGRIVARSSLTTRSGQRAAIGQVRPGVAWPTPLQPSDQKPGESSVEVEAESGPGLRLEVEPFLGADGDLMDINFACSFGLQPEPPGSPLIVGKVTTAVSLRSGHYLLQRLSLESTAWKEVAMLLGATVNRLDGAGWKDGERMLTPREQRWRSLGKAGGK